MQYKSKSILITGGSGSWGNELTKRLLKEEPKEIIIFSRNEFMQVTMRRKFDNPKIRFVIGDVRDYDSIRRATKGVDIVFHLAALKHIELCEEQPWETVLTNIIGTQNVINACIDNDVERMIDVSTDKSCAPVNLYGFTKGVGEKLVIQANNMTDRTMFTCIKSGNVMGSNGSVIQFFIDQINKNNEVTITDFRMTRYFLTLPEAIELLLIASDSGIAGATFVVKMPACLIYDLARILVKHYGNESTTFKEIGLRPGEKLHESLVSRDESNRTYVYDKGLGHYYLINPSIEMKRYGGNNIAENMGFKRVDFNEYNSSTFLMSENEIEEMLKKGGFI